MICKACKTGTVAPSNVRARVNRCAKCVYASSSKAAKTRYRHTTKGRTANARSNAKRVWIGRHYAVYMPTTERARAARAHVNQRIREFEDGRQRGA